ASASLSLHDALPISPTAHLGGRLRKPRGAQSRWRHRHDPRSCWPGRADPTEAGTCGHRRHCRGAVLRLTPAARVGLLMQETRLKRIARQVHEALDDLSILDRHDRNALAEHSQLRRIVWLTEGGTGEAARQAGGRPASHAPDLRCVSTWVRIENAQAHIYAEDRATCELLLDRVIAALDETCGPSFAGFSYRWVTEEQPNAGVTLRA